MPAISFLPIANNVNYCRTFFFSTITTVDNCNTMSLDQTFLISDISDLLTQRCRLYFQFAPNAELSRQAFLELLISACVCVCLFGRLSVVCEWAPMCVLRATRTHPSADLLWLC